MAKAVIFDIDGTLIDSVRLHALAWQETLRLYGYDVDCEAVSTQIGKGGDKLLAAFLSPKEIKKYGKRIQKERDELFRRKYLPRVKPFPNVVDLFERLKADGKKIALASSANEDEVAAYKRIMNVEQFLDAETSFDDVRHSKPDPDVFLAALKKLGRMAPHDVIAVGDTPYDAEAAGKAGMPTVGMLCGASNAPRLRAAGCIALYRDPADLLENYWTSAIHKPEFWQSPNVRNLQTSSQSKNQREEVSMRSRNGSLYFLLGFGIGAAVALLSVPQKGAATREFLRTKAKESTDYAKRSATEGAEFAKQQAEELKRTAAEVVDRAKAAVEAGKQAYNEVVDSASPRA